MHNIMYTQLRYATPSHSQEEAVKKTGDSKGQFEVVASHAQETWNRLLKRVDVVDPGEYHMM